MMHIPKTGTDALVLSSFDDAYREAQAARDDYDTSRWLYVPPVYDEYRYILGTRGKKPLFCIGVNPSTAAPDALDNTLKSVERIALHNGFDSFLMFNVYAQRATDPDDMEKLFNPRLHAENLRALGYMLEKVDERPTVWAAWGTIAEKRDFLFSCIDDMRREAAAFSPRWVSCGAISKKGHPHHPLYLKADSLLSDFDMDAYCRTFCKTHNERTETAV